MANIRVEREREMVLEDALSRLPAGCPDAGASILITTTTVSAYPTFAAAFFAANPTEINGEEYEGSSASFSPDTNRVIYALNQGSQIPPAGTQLIAHAAGGRWVFRYDG